ncbi:MAG: LamG-like jellyroll fold domain-containing protein, partial [Actinomycetota bacterium]
MKKLGSVLAAALVLALVTPAHAATSGSTWSMEETSGTAMLDSTGPNNGTLNGVTLGQPGRPGSPGLHSFGFNGTSSSVVVPNNSTLNPGSQDFSFTAWLDLSGTPGTGNFDYDIIRKGAGWKMEAFPHSGVVTAQCVFSGSVKVTLHAPQINGIGLDDHAWHVVTCARSASGETVTVDGSVVATSFVQVGSISNTDDVYLGAQKKGVDHYLGLMDDVSFTIGTATPPPPPTITSFSPSSGPVGTPVSINGTNFTGASDVRFNGLSVGAGNFTVNSSILITATVPAGATNGLITVVAPGGT